MMRRRHNKDLDDSIQQCPVILSNTEIKNVTNVTNVNQTKCYQNGVEKSCFDSECPTLSEKYLESKLYLKDTSLSPWKWIVNYDENRDPQCLAEAKCLCNGCVDPFSRTENLDLRSVPITIDRHVKIKRNGKYVDDVVTLNMGCRCDFRISS
ncbi:unnamed protein product [Clavelina lepadiformis]|uniref:Uncharacterized protein n=1 Tax=Clavelina lepadiformis TaxID=159417 RepID=A0ABP0FDJ6_CLALP